MAPKKIKRTAEEEEAVRLAERSVALERQGKRSKIMKGLDARPDLLDSVWLHLSKVMSRDRLEPVGGGQEYATPPTRPNWSPEMASSADGNAAAAIADDAETTSRGSASLEALLEGNSMSGTALMHSMTEKMSPITCVGQLSIPLLERFLAAVEPIALSSNAQRALRGPRSRYISKEKLLQIYEHITALSPTDPFPEYFHCVSKWLAAGVDFNKDCGRPARDLCLPPNWEQNGCYKIQAGELSGRPKVVHVVLAQSKGIEAFRDSCYGSMHIEMNFSPKLATLVDADGMFRLPLVSLFPDAASKNLNRHIQNQLLTPRSVSTLSLASSDAGGCQKVEPQNGGEKEVDEPALAPGKVVVAAIAGDESESEGLPPQ